MSAAATRLMVWRRLERSSSRDPLIAFALGIGLGGLLPLFTHQYRVAGARGWAQSWMKSSRWEERWSYEGKWIIRPIFSSGGRNKGLDALTTSQIEKLAYQNEPVRIAYGRAR